MAAAISTNNLDLPLGDIQDRNFMFSLRVNGRLGSVAEISNLSLGRILKLGNITQVSL